MVVAADRTRIQLAGDSEWRALGPHVMRPWKNLRERCSHRYGVVFRRLLERETLAVTWYELGRIYRRWEARGEIRGGYFVGGVSGEQFALPEAIGLLRSIRKTSAKGELITLSAADPLNLQGILTPGPRVAALTANRILFRDGLPVAALEAGEIATSADDPFPMRK